MSLPTSRRMDVTVCCRGCCVDPSKRKVRCWQFHLCGISNGDKKEAHAAALASFRYAYTAAKRLTVSPTPGCRDGCRDEVKHKRSCTGNIPSPDSTTSQRYCCVVVEVQFSGPQSAERPALLLNRLFQAERVAVHPVALRRGRKRSPEQAKNKEVLGGRNEESRASGRIPKSSQQARNPAINVSNTSNNDNTNPNTMKNWTRATKRSASGANLPSNLTDLSTKQQEDEGYLGGGGRGRGGAEISDSYRIHDDDLDDDLDDEEDDFWNSFEEEGEDPTTIAAYTSALGRNLLCGAFTRCVDPLTWVAEDEEIDAAVYDRGALLSGPRRRRRSHDRANNANADDNDSQSASPSASAATKTAAAELEIAAVGYWTDIDLDASVSGNEDVGDDDVYVLSPLTVASSPFLRIAPDTDVLKCTAVTALTGSLRVSPLTVRPPGSAPSRTRPARSFFLEDSDRSRHKTDASLLHHGGDGGGGAPAALRASWNAGGVACVLEGNDTGGAAGGVGSGLTPGGGTLPSPSCLGRGTGAVAGGQEGGGSQQKNIKKERDGPRRRSIMAVEPLHQEFDFEGRPAQLEKLMDSPFAAAFCVPPGEDDEQHLVFLGLLEGTGQPLRNLTARVRFSVSSGKRADKEVGPLQAAANGRVYGTVQYPSMKELWPDLHSTQAVRAVEVDLIVEVRSLDRKVRHLRFELKVMYRREKVGRSQGASWRP